MSKIKVNFKKIISLAAAAVLTFQIFIFSPVLVADAQTGGGNNVNDFKDVSPSDWFYVYVKRLYEDGLVNGVAKDTYAPYSETKTSEVAAFIVRYLGNEYEAEKAKNYLKRNNIDGADLWYSGYIQTMCDMGIFDKDDIERYGLKITETGAAHISEEAAKAIEAPLKRMHMAKFIAKSFEIIYWRTQADGPLPREISGNGHELITGGGYDAATLEKIKPLISDYGAIPDGYHMYFLKCYYNGIVRGNGRGEVLPETNLKRGELAKIIATAMYFDLRGEDLRELPEPCKISESDYAVLSVDGSLSLKREKAEQILKEQASYTKASNNGDSVGINVIRQNVIPKGFLCEIYIYRYDGSATYEVAALNNSANTNSFFPKEESFSIAKAGKSGSDSVGYIYFILRDLQRNGETAGALMFNITASGTLAGTSVYYIS